MAKTRKARKYTDPRVFSKEEREDEELLGSHLLTEEEKDELEASIEKDLSSAKKKKK